MTNADRKQRVFEHLQLLDDFSIAHQFPDNGFIQSITNENFKILSKHHDCWGASEHMPNIVLYEADDQTKACSAFTKLSESEPDVIHRKTIENCSQMHFGMEANGKRCTYAFIAYEEDKPENPIGYICFAFSILNEWETDEETPKDKEIALCLHMLHLYVKSPWRNKGIAHCLSDIIMHRFTTQLQFVAIQLKAKNITLVPLIYEGVSCIGAEHIIQDCEKDLSGYISFIMKKIHLRGPISNIESRPASP